MDKNKIKDIFIKCGLFGTWMIQRNILVADLKAIKLMICSRIDDQYHQTIGTLVYLHTLDAHKYDVLFKNRIIKFIGTVSTLGAEKQFLQDTDTIIRYLCEEDNL